MSSDYEWCQQQQIPATEGESLVGMPLMFSAVSVHRANLNSILPHQADARNFAQIGPPMPIHDPIREDNFLDFTGSTPILASQPAGLDEAQPCARYNGEGMDDTPSNGWLAKAAFDGHSACTLEGPSSGGGGSPDVGFVDLSGLGPWTMSATAVDEYGAQARQGFLPGYGNGAAQSPYDSQTREYVGHNGGRGTFRFCDRRGPWLTIWS